MQNLDSSRDALSRWDFGYPGFAEDVLEYEFLNQPDYDRYPPVSKPFWHGFSSRDTFVQRFRNRNASVLNYFANRPDDLLVLYITKDKTTRKFFFFGSSLMLETAMPHLNQDD